MQCSDARSFVSVSVSVSVSVDMIICMGWVDRSLDSRQKNRQTGRYTVVQEWMDGWHRVRPGLRVIDVM